jgi:hypothetical protein
MHYIYHIPGVKIGATKQPEIRIKEQGFTEYEILEQYEDVYITSKREIELQKQYGYRIDAIPYWQTLKNRTIEGSIKGGITQGNINAKNGHAKKQFQLNSGVGGKAAHKNHPELYKEWGKKIGKIAASIKVECPHCGKIGQRAAMGNWHFDKCKQKNK